MGEGAGEALARWAKSCIGLDGKGSPNVAVQPGPVTNSGWENIERLMSAGTMTLYLGGPSGQKSSIILDSKLVGALIGLALRTSPLPIVGRPSLGEQGLVNYAMAGLLLELGSGCAWSLEQTRAFDAQSSTGFLIIEAQVTLGDVLGLAWLVLEERALLHFPPRPSPLHEKRQGRLAGLSLWLPIEIGRFSINEAELALLGAGDVILSPGCPRRNPSLRAVLRIGSGGFSATVTASQLTVGASYCRGGCAMAFSDSDKTSIAEQLPVEMVIEIGRVQVTGAQVLDLEPGDVITMNRPFAGGVDVRVGNRLIARGELVDVEGEAGVRLSEVYD